jgi:hypothetical protein
MRRSRDFMLFSTNRFRRLSAMHVDDLRRELAARVANAPAPRGNVNVVIGRGRRRRAIRRVCGVVVAAALVVAIAVPIAARQRAHNAVVTTGPPPAPIAITDSSWALHPKALAGLEAGTSFHALATSPHSLLLAGARLNSNGWQAAIWYSDDGATWTQAQSPSTTGEILAIAVAGDNALAVGTESRGSFSFVWRSADDGRHWTPVTRGTQLFGAPAPQMGRPFVTGLLSVNGTWLADGGGSDGYAAAWTSRDGTQWRPVLDSVNARTAGSVDITTTAHGQLFGYWVTAGWYSANGTSWGQPVTLSVPDRWFLATVAPGAGVAFGNNLDRPGLPTPLLRSHDDGHTWTIDPNFLARFPDATVLTVTRADGLWIATGWSGTPNHPDAWVSTDLSAWHALPKSLYGKPGGNLSLIGTIGDRIVLVGTAPELNRYYTLDTRNRTPSPTTPTGQSSANARPAVTTRVELSSDSVVAGRTASGALVVDNETGKPIRTPMCAYWEVQLTNQHVPVESLRLAKCGPGPAFAVGVHRYPFTVAASYGCGPVPPPTGPCGSNGPPPLPVGEYHAVLVQEGTNLPTPVPVSVRVVAHS